jgi:IS605 OrfB family transposase
MKQTIKFRLYPTALQEQILHEIFTIYNRVRRIGYKHLFVLKDSGLDKTEKWGIVQPRLMDICHNNPYVNSMLKDCETKLAQQHTWFKKRKKYLKQQAKTINKKIERVKQKDGKDRRLTGLYSRLSSVQSKIHTMRFKSVVFGTKRLFRQRILGRISKEEFRTRRDSSFCCVGKRQTKNDNLKIQEDATLRIRTFSKLKGKKWLIIPFAVNNSQERWFKEILGLDHYQVEVVRRFKKKNVRFFAHVSYNVPKSEIKYGFEHGAVGLDMNYDFVSLCNADKSGNFKSYSKISFENLHSYRKNRRADYISYKMDKVINYCLNKNKGLVIENLSFDQEFSYGKRRNRKLSNFKISALALLERKCIKRGVAIEKIHPAYTSLIGKYKYSCSRNLSTHMLASYVIARKGLGFKEEIPARYKWLLAQVGDAIKPRLKPSSPYYNWAKLHDFFKHCGITSFKTSEVMQKTLQMKHVMNSVTSAQPDNLRAGLSPLGKVGDWHKFWNFVESSKYL